MRNFLMSEVSQDQRAKFGLIGFLFAIISLVIIMIQLSAILEPQEQTAGSIIGEIAADIKKSAARALSGEPAPEPTPPPKDYGQYITIAALCIAGLGVIFGGLGLYYNEPHRLAYMAVGFGISAFVLQYVFWLALLICGVILLIGILNNIDGIFS
jgi:hypothetical protein